ncbi:hypothetical protein RTM1035_02315 [Roseovarius sp. TM1035]|nr:hypothetical protein RTM1035_02315 [Roseovarius sp. TM1035]
MKNSYDLPCGVTQDHRETLKLGRNLGAESLAFPPGFLPAHSQNTAIAAYFAVQIMMIQQNL